MGEMTQFKRPDGKACLGYLATPKAGSSASGFVVIQEWWGLNDQIKKTAARLAGAGYRALVPDLYRGKVTKAADEANHLMTTLNFADAAGQDIRGAVQYLKQSSKKVAVGGFCMGGALTILAALLVPEMDAGACFYGIPPVDAADLEKIKIPLICHFANRDDWCTPAKVNELEAALKQSKSVFEIYRYDAQHAFMNEARPEVYNATCAKTAWERTLKFLKKTLP
ncbi:MAG: dienelactone hydrolase family protein [Candidatus Acidiferrales bacterium]|jgi:carboxymethylenebutenolidase